LKSSKFIIVTLLSITIIAMEMSWTRIFSADFFYTYAFLVLSLAIAGLGMGALALRIFPGLNKDHWLGLSLSLTGFMAIISPPAVLHLGLNFVAVFQSWMMAGKLILSIFLLGSAFFFGGIALAKLFKRNHEEMPRLYMADLIGAGLGVIVSIILMNTFGTQTAVFLSSLPVLLAAIIASASKQKIVPAIFILMLILAGANASDLLTVKQRERMPVIYQHWDAMAKIKMYEYPEGQGRGYNIDNVANSYIYPFDGNWDIPDSMKFQFGIPVDYLIKQFDSCIFLSLGSGGGSEVLQALQEGATEIHAVEVNGHINKMMTDGDRSGYLNNIIVAADSIKGDSIEYRHSDSVTLLPEFTGNIYHDPKVKVITEDARSYVRKHENKFDVIYSLSSNTWAALSSGSFALAENYLFTTEAFKDYWIALSDSGFMMMEHQLYMPRLVAELVNAFEELGIEDYKDHFAVYALPQMRRNALLLSKRPLDDSLRYHALIDLMPEYYTYIHLLYPPADDSIAGNLVNQVVENGWEAASDSTPLNIAPCDDNSPFTAQLGLWKNFDLGKHSFTTRYGMDGFPLTQSIIIVILLIVLVIILPLNLIPYWKNKDKLKLVPFIYFFMIGLAYMAVEVVLLQKYTFFVGPTVYSIATIIVTLLIGSGIGSRFARKFSNMIAFIGIIVWLLLDIFVFKHVIYGIVDVSIYSRMFITTLLIFPLGFFMGMPFPKGALRVKELIDWGFAVNGAASVIGSTAIVLISISWGFQSALLVGVLLYLIAFLLLSVKKAW